MHPDQHTPDDHHIQDPESEGNAAPAPPDLSDDAEAEATRAHDDERGDEEE